MEINNSTPLKKAIQRWRRFGVGEDNGTEVDLSKQWWPIRKLDRNLWEISHCEQLILNDNRIEKIQCLQGFYNLTYLSMNLNQIKSLKGLETIGKTLKVLLLNNNLVRSTKGIENLKVLEVLKMEFNMLQSWDDFDRLRYCNRLVNISLKDNKFNGNLPLKIWIELASRRNPRLLVIEDIFVRKQYLRNFYPHTIIEPCTIDGIKQKDSTTSVNVEEEEIAEEKFERHSLAESTYFPTYYGEVDNDYT